MPTKDYGCTVNDTLAVKITVPADESLTPVITFRLTGTSDTIAGVALDPSGMRRLASLLTQVADACEEGVVCTHPNIEITHGSMGSSSYCPDCGESHHPVEGTD